MDEDIGRFLGLAMFAMGNEIESHPTIPDDERLLNKFKTGIQLSTFVEIKYGKLEVKVSAWRENVLEKLKKGTEKPYKLKPVRESEFEERHSAKHSLKERNRKHTDLQSENDMSDYTLDESIDREQSEGRGLDASNKWSANLNALNINQISNTPNHRSSNMQSTKNKNGFLKNGKAEPDYKDIIKRLKMDKDRIQDRINTKKGVPSITLFPTQPHQKGKYDQLRSKQTLDPAYFDRDRMGNTLNSGRPTLARNRTMIPDGMEWSRGQMGSDLLQAGSRGHSRKGSMLPGSIELDGLMVGGVGFKGDESEVSMRHRLNPRLGSSPEELSSILKATDQKYHLGLLLRDLAVKMAKKGTEEGQSQQEKVELTEQTRGGKERRGFAFRDKLLKDSAWNGPYKGQNEDLIRELLNNPEAFKAKRLISVEKVMGSGYDRHSVIQSSLTSLVRKGRVTEKTQGEDSKALLQDENRSKEEAALRIKLMKERIGTSG